MSCNNRPATNRLHEVLRIGQNHFSHSKALNANRVGGRENTSSLAPYLATLSLDTDVGADGADESGKRKRTEMDDLVRETDALEDELNRSEQGPGPASQLAEMQIVSGRRDDGLTEVREATVALVREIIRALEASDDYGELKLLEETARANLSRIPGRSDVANTARKLLEKLIRQLTDKLSTRSPCFQRAETTVTSRCESLRCSAGAGSVARDA